MPTLTKSAFATALKFHRKRIGVSQEKMAYLIGGVTSRTLAHWEKGDHSPNAIMMDGVLAKLAAMKPITPQEYRDKCAADVKALTSRK